MAEIFHSRFNTDTDGFTGGTWESAAGSALLADVDGSLAIGAGATATRDFTEITSGTSRVDFWFKITDAVLTATSSATVFFLLPNGAAASSANTLGCISLARDPAFGATATKFYLTYRDASNFVQWYATPVLTRGDWWYKLSVVVNHTAKTCDFYVQDQLWLLALAWPNASATGLGRIAINGNASAGKVWFDNIRVESDWSLPTESTLLSDDFTTSAGALVSTAPTDTRNLHPQAWVGSTNTTYGNFTRTASGLTAEASKKNIALVRCGPEGIFTAQFVAATTGDVYGGVALRVWGGPMTDAYYIMRYYSASASKMLLVQGATTMASATNPAGLTISAGDTWEIKIEARGRNFWCYMRNVTTSSGWQVQFGGMVGIRTDATGARGLLSEDHAGVYVDRTFAGVGATNYIKSFSWSGRAPQHAVARTVGRHKYQIEPGSIKEWYALDSGSPTDNLFWSRGIQFSHRAEHDMGEDAATEQQIIYDGTNVVALRQRGVLMSEDNVAGYGDSYVTLLRRGPWVEDGITAWGNSYNLAPDHDLRSDRFIANGYLVASSSGASTALSHTPEHDWRTDQTGVSLPLGIQALATFGAGNPARFTAIARNNLSWGGTTANQTNKTTGDGAPISMAFGRNPSDTVDLTTYKQGRAYLLESAAALTLSDATIQAWRSDASGAATLSVAVGTANTSVAGDTNTDGFNERHGWYELTAAAGGSTFTMPVPSGARYMPAFRISGFTPATGLRLTLNGSPAYVGIDYVIDTVASGIHVLQLLGTLTANTTVALTDAAPYSDTTAPTLTGSITVGTVTTSDIQVTWPAGADDTAVVSYETSPDGSTWTDRGDVLTYTFTGLVASTSYALRVRAKDAAGNVSTPALSVTQSTSAGASVPVNTAAPAVTGSAVQGQTLTSSTGAWTNSPISYAYRWLRGASAIGGATSSTYVLQAGDVGSQVRVGVIATNATGSSTEALSLQTAVVTASGDTTAPTLTGELTIGTVTSSSIQITWPAGADNEAVASYETSPDGSTWTDRGAVLTYTFTGLAASTSYTLRVRAKDAAGNVSTPALSATQSTSSAIDTAAPTLTSPACTATSASTASGSVSTNESGGTLYRLASINATELAATVKAAALSQSVVSAGAQAASFTGLAASTPYFAHFVHTDAAGNDSARVSSAAFTTLAVGTATFSTPRGAVTLRGRVRHIGGVITEDIHQA
jgi:hypothetical protein